MFCIDKMLSDAAGKAEIRDIVGGADKNSSPLMNDMDELMLRVEYHAYLVMKPKFIMEFAEWKNRRMRITTNPATFAAKGESL